jgi:frataxin-like iron-binding protein CyaY
MEVFASWKRPPSIICLLRNPADRILSSFRYTQGNANRIDRDLSFDEYVEALLMNDPDKIAPNYTSQASLWVATRELFLSHYLQWLDKWTSTVGEERLMILLSEELISNPKATIKAASSRLGLDSSAYDSYPFHTQNSSMQPRSQRIHRWARRIGRQIPTSGTKSALRSAYTLAQIDRQQQKDLERDREALRRLDEHFEPCNERLAQRFGLDLQHWQVER